SFGMPVRTVRADVHVVTDFGPLFGVMTSTDEGTFGTILDQSSSTPIYFQISPRDQGAAPRVSRSHSLEHQVVRVTEGDLQSPGHCEELESPSTTAKASSSARSSAPQTDALTFGWRGLDMMVISPTEFTARRSDAQVVGQVLNTIETTNFFFESLEIVVQLSALQILRDDQFDIYEVASASDDPYLLLDTVQYEWRSKPLPSRDAIAVFSRRILGGVYGLAYTSSTCVNPEYSILFASQGGSDTHAELALAATFAHELGHLVGMKHDGTKYPSGASLMFPVALPIVTGFSPLSIAQFQSFAGHGQRGGECLEAREAPTIPSGISAAVRNVTLREGERFREAVRFSGLSQPVWYSVNRLPKGAAFDPSTGALSYEPRYDVASVARPRRRVSVEVTAHHATGLKTTKIVFDVQNVNRPPTLRSTARSNTIDAKPGSIVRFAVAVRDPDAGDTVSIGFRSKRLFRALGGEKRFSRSGNRFTVEWAVPRRFRGDVPLEFGARDSAGQSSVLAIRIRVAE
ncbi:MAG: hypothetical protein IT290_02765, partial [Deltaproteobacteria bacterium]|nr:hypothetical protein [Deltaproteobacteria bacterium]